LERRRLYDAISRPQAFSNPLRLRLAVPDFSEAKSTISFCVLLIAELAIDSVVYWIGLLLFALRSTQTERKSSLRFEV